jgi:nucleotide-binding universal stress UspA family protein
MSTVEEEEVASAESQALDTVDQPDPFLDRVVVPVDGSPFAERALPVGAQLAAETGARLVLLEVVTKPRDAELAIHYLDDLARRHGAAGWDAARGEDTASAIVTAAGGDRSGLACLATHGRDRSTALVGSVATGVLDRTTRPVLLVGPKARPPCAGDAPIVVAVDGSSDDRAVVAVASDWARALARPLVVATVAEPVPESFEPGRPLDRMRGPAHPEAYVAGLAGEAGATAVRSTVDYDPVSVRGGLVRLVDRTAGLLVLGAHRRTRPLRALVGSHAARIVHDIEVPALVVPLGTGR